MIKLAAFDVYGTILAFRDTDRSRVDSYSPPRPGLETLLDECKKRGIIAVTSSDVDSYHVTDDLDLCFKRFPQRGLSVRIFSDFMCLDQPGVKDYDVILDKYELEPDELLVFDDVLRNVQAAQEIGCHAVQCPKYVASDRTNWSFAGINLDSFA